MPREESHDVAFGLTENGRNTPVEAIETICEDFSALLLSACKPTGLRKLHSYLARLGRVQQK